MSSSDKSPWVGLRLLPQQDSLEFLRGHVEHVNTGIELIHVQVCAQQA